VCKISILYVVFNCPESCHKYYVSSGTEKNDNSEMAVLY
jgi:hypothetical protein